MRIILIICVVTARVPKEQIYRGALIEQKNMVEEEDEERPVLAANVFRMSFLV